MNLNECKLCSGVESGNVNNLISTKVFKVNLMIYLPKNDKKPHKLETIILTSMVCIVNI